MDVGNVDEPLNQRENPRRTAGIFSVAFFSWVLPLLLKGTKNELEQEDLYKVLEEDESGKLGELLEREWSVETEKALRAAATNNHLPSTDQPKVAKGYRPSLAKATVRAFWKDMTLTVLIVFIEEMLIRILQPVCLGYYLAYFSGSGGEEDVTRSHAWLSGLAIVLLSCLFSICHHLQFFSAQWNGMRLRVAFGALIYRKATRLNQSALENNVVGKMVNLLSNDVGRFDFILLFVAYLVIAPLQLFVVTYLSWLEVGWVILPGAALLLCLIPFQMYMARMFSKFREKTAKKTDARIRLVNEILQGIRVVKMYTWEHSFARLVKAARRAEVRVIRNSCYFRSVNFCVFAVIGQVILMVVLLPLVLQNVPVTSAMVFLLLTWINVLKLSLAIFLPNAVAMMSESLVSVKRIQSFLMLEELEKKEMTPFRPRDEVVVVPNLKMDHVCCRWSRTGMKDTLTDVDLEVKTPELVAIVGPMGCGKSSLIQAILSELPATSGNVQVNGDASYAPQIPWVFASSLRDNILFGKRFDEERYLKVVEVCGLNPDLALFKQGDEMQVGERGVSLSGGQKARISLARSVGKHIYEQCILEHLKGKIVVLVTHQLHLLQSVNRIFVMDQGRVCDVGNYKELMDKSKGLFASLLQREESKSNEEGDQFLIKDLQNHDLLSSVHSAKKSLKADEASLHDEHALVIPQHVGNDVEDEKEEEEEEPDADDDIDNLSLQPATAVATSNSFVEHQMAEQQEMESGKEISSKGAVKLSTYWMYIRSGSTIFNLLVYFAFMIFMHGSVVFANIWLSRWTGDKQLQQNHNNQTTLITKHFVNIHQMYYGIYVAAVLTLIITSIASTLQLFLLAMRSSKQLHNDMFLRILRTKMSFFDKHPSGMILNRFSKDLGNIDDLLPPSLLDITWTFFSMLAILIVITYVQPLMLILTMFLFVMFYILRGFYIKSARAIKRVEAVARSPIFSQVSMSLEGLPVIRASRMEEELIRTFDKLQDVHSSAWFSFISCDRWLAVSSDWIATVFIGCITLSFMVFDKDQFTSSEVGLSVSTSFLLIGAVQYGMRQMAQVENFMTSVERIVEYSKLESEDELIKCKDDQNPDRWIHEGIVNFSNVCLKYDEHDSQLVLTDISCKTKSTEKIGIVGRTGAGKSSLISLLFRLVEPTSGKILIDGQSIKEKGLHELRRNMSIIPQDPLLFTGSLRSNLDPFGSYSDDDLWKALELAHMLEAIKLLEGGMDAEVSEGGSNFSVGQRQLICLARAILRDNKILILDEATANVDPRTDTLIQETIRRQFSNCTVFTIAHRLHTVMKCDRIMVMSQGQIKEFGVPHTLLQDNSGALSQFVNHMCPKTQEALKQIAFETFQSQVNA